MATKKTISILLLFIFAASLVAVVSAATQPTIDFKVTPLNTSVFRDQSATYELRIINKGNEDDRFQLSSPSAKFIASPVPKLESRPIKSGSFEDFLLNIYAKGDTYPGPYGVPIKIKSLVTGAIYEVTLPINIKEENSTVGVYPPAPSLKLSLPSRADPRDELKLDVQLKNGNPRDLPEVIVTIQSDLFRKTYATSLSGMEEKGSEFSFNLDPLLHPGRHTIMATLTYEGKVYAEETKTFDIIPYRVITPDEKVKRELFKTTITATYTNEGNAQETVEKRLPSNWLRSVFTTASPAFEKVHDNGKSYLQWNFQIAPQEQYTITAVENYRIPVVIIIAIVIIVILYYILRSPVVCDKDAQVTSTKEGISDIKVKLFLRNRSGQTIKSIRIIDRIPAIAELVTSDALGTMQPGKVVKDVKRGTIVRFDVHTLDPFEERIVTYKMKSKLKIIGGISLHPAKVKFETGKGTERSVYSNEVNIKKRGF